MLGKIIREENLPLLTCSLKEGSNDKTLNLMGRYDKKDGFYPNYRANKDLKSKIEDTINVISYAMKRNIREARLRVLINDVYEYLERFEGFHYGISEGVSMLNDNEINSEQVILDHAVPSNVIIRTLKAISPNEKDLLDFFRRHYYMCLLTKKENKEVDKELRMKMPSSWKLNDWANWDARYREKGIVLKIKPGKNNAS